MHYHEAAAFLFDLRRFSVKPGTERVAALLDQVGNPEEDVSFVQVAGSNGKGSTARMTESILREAGLSVGLYTSPHLSALADRVRVDGLAMTEAAIADFVEEVKPWLVERAANGEPLTFFEVVTAMAIHDFARREVDVAVLEVGLGGEYDATSAVDPVATAVTNVSLEHTAVLGDTIAEIARTKARIADAGVPLVTACEGEALSVVREVANDAGAPIATVARASGSSGNGETDDQTLSVAYEGRVSPTDAEVTLAGEVDGTYRIPLVGDHQATNAGIAVALARRTAGALGNGTDASLPDEAVRDGLARATWPGRFEVVDTAPLTVLDGAHNPAACRTLAGTLAEYDYDDLHLVYGAMHDKDHVGAASALPDADSAVTCRPDLDRAEDPEVLAAALRTAGVDDVTAGDDVAAALETAVERADLGDCVLLVGSLFAVAEARAARMRTVTPRTVSGSDPDANAARALDIGGVPTGDESGASRRRREGIDHRVLSLRLRGDRAERLTAALREAGGDAAIGGLGAGEGRVPGGEYVPVTLAGTVGEYRELLGRLREREGEEFAGIAGDIADRVGIDDSDAADSAPDDYPWIDGTAIMGVLNVTPDSFHDGGRHAGPDDAVAGVERMVEAGVDVVDVGGESTRPGAEPVPVDEEIDRVVPTLEAIQSVPAVADSNVLISVDTRKPAVAAAALDAGADIINDVTGLADPEMREVVADAGCPVVVMHSLDAPVDPTNDPEYDDVVDDVIAALRERLALAETAGIDREKVIVDPGLGFGKSATEAFDLIDRVGEFAALDCPVLIGHSHKSMYGAVGRGEDDREHATVAATALAADRGADIVRAHDIAENRAAVDVAAAVNGSLRERGGADENGDGDPEGGAKGNAAGE
ncbi:dihydropteroate synthase [Halorubrum lacusprofundi]|jgi:dihydropteroate synthase|uniref:Probable bifunctional folylpolyglutamate synthase/dihydropteroate synthase n=1 Tax=Halorubrum lacusprofundi (strain ATCC 49239 / DSM 5036 / JCM 8891 / ACAM 34) TaxID=416348 RepID=B9LS84_HALLT|nr:dihydropteroate synthase [Halorubrum lacusprofundi]ACM55929.1 dihydropteroate synthase [Halorubrum lacusprofundi ATCC 49239]MCG1006798.1 dihydropteroate synthase [Halorubrum lacusprofundi]